MTRKQNIAAFDAWAKDKSFGEVYADFPINDPACQENPAVILMKSIWDAPWVDAPLPRIGPPMDSALGLLPSLQSNSTRQPAFRPAFFYDLLDNAATDLEAIKLLLLKGARQADGYASGLDADDLDLLYDGALVHGEDGVNVIRKSALRAAGHTPIEGVDEAQARKEKAEPMYALVEKGVVTDVLPLSRIPRGSFGNADWRPFEDNQTPEVRQGNAISQVWLDTILPDRVSRTYTLVPLDLNFKTKIARVKGDPK